MQPLSVLPGPELIEFVLRTYVVGVVVYCCGVKIKWRYYTVSYGESVLQTKQLVLDCEPNLVCLAPLSWKHFVYTCDRHGTAIKVLVLDSRNYIQHEERKIMNSYEIVHAQCTCSTSAIKSCVNVSALVHALECFESQKIPALQLSLLVNPQHHECGQLNLKLP